MKISESRKKLLELTKYIITRADEDVFLGSVKLNKILFLCDFLYFRENGNSITGQSYRHQPLGPVPSDMRFLKAKYETKQFATAYVNSGPYQQRRLVALKKPNLRIFTAEMISFVDRIIETLCLGARVTSKGISEHSHEYIGWLKTKMNEVIPYETIFLANTTRQTVTLIDRIRTEKMIKDFDGRYGIDKRTQRDAIQIGTSTA